MFLRTFDEILLRIGGIILVLFDIAFKLGYNIQ